MAVVHQLVPVFEPGAVGAALLQGRALLRAAGHESEIVADEIDPRFAAVGAVSSASMRGELDRSDVTAVYHLAIGAPMADDLAARRCRLAVAYHNLTPAEFLEPWDPALGPATRWGRKQLEQLAPRSALGIAMSRYSERELTDAGYATTTTVPVLFDPAALAEPDAAMLSDRKASRRGTDWLFVSRIAPNKAQHHVVRAFALWRAAHDPGARLVLAGSSASATYSSALRGYIEALGLSDAVAMPGALAPGALAAHYAAADVFVCLSDHEGFAVPLLEAWGHDLPVVAFAAAAVPETAGDAAIVLRDKSAAAVAAAVERVRGDDAVRAELIARGRRRLATEYDPVRVGARFVAALEAVA